MILTAQEAWEFSLLALCNWREARGEIVAAKMAQAWSVRNRVLRPSWWGTDYCSVILKPLQYSSFNASDPNAIKFPQPGDTAWQASLMAAESAYMGVGNDPAQGCTNYFDKSLDGNLPDWAKKMIHVFDIGNLRFYR